jgi:hypothetical protein
VEQEGVQNHQPGIKKNSSFQNLPIILTHKDYVLVKKNFTIK